MDAVEREDIQVKAELCSAIGCSMRVLGRKLPSLLIGSSPGRGQKSEDSRTGHLHKVQIWMRKNVHRPMMTAIRLAGNSGWAKQGIRTNGAGICHKHSEQAMIKKCVSQDANEEVVTPSRYALFWLMVHRYGFLRNHQKPRGWVTLKKHSAGSTTMQINDADCLLSKSEGQCAIHFFGIRILPWSDWKR